MNNNKGMYWLVVLNLVLSIITLLLLYRHAQVAVELSNSNAFFSSEYPTVISDESAKDSLITDGNPNPANARLFPLGDTGYDVYFVMDSSGAVTARVTATGDQENLVDDSDTQ